MATVLEFPSGRAHLARGGGPAPGAEIVFFPGVRVERLECGTRAPEPPAKGRGKLENEPD